MNYCVSRAWDNVMSRISTLWVTIIKDTQNFIKALREDKGFRTNRNSGKGS